MATDSKPGLFQVLWADLRKKPLPSEPDPDDQEWLEQQREMGRQASARVGRVHSLSEQQFEQLRRRYWQTTN